MNKTESRKDEHVSISLNENISNDHNYWDDVKLIHNALPEINKDEVDLSTNIFSKKLGAPIIISAMTGGYKKAKKINKNLAAAADKFQLGMGVGSQRAAIETPDLADTYSVVKDYNIPIRLANIGASQIVLWGRKKSLEYATKMIDMIDADVFVVCLNFLQEVMQPEGEAHAKGVLDAISNLSDDLDVPIIVKESGAGISYDVAEKLSKTKIAGIDVGGAGGTSFSAIEYYRSKKIGDDLHARGGKTFWNWGIPTPTSIIDVIDATKGKIPVIATGGIRNGLDAAKSVVLGAKAAGVARSVLKPAIDGETQTIFELEAIIKEFRATMFLVGAKDVNGLNEVDCEIWI